MNHSRGSKDSGSAVVHLQVDPGLSLPPAAAVEDWVTATLEALAARGHDVAGQIGIRMLDSESSAQLNRDYRDKAGPTNVLSFPAVAVPGLPEEEARPYLGDLAICLPLVEEQASQQGKTVQAHLAHMVVHGLLHLNGYDHLTDVQAHEMEELETRILRDLGFPDPYATEHSTQS